MICNRWSALMVWSLFLVSARANAAQYVANVFLDGLQEVPPVATTGTGTATVTFDDVTGMMNVNGSFSNMIGTSNNAHVHGYAAAGAPAGVVFGLTFDAGVTSGNFSGSGTIPAGNIADVLNDLTYINIHSSFRPGGEVRGQIDLMLIPEPASVVLAVIAVLGVCSFRRWS
jgi:hypothetical protein